MGIIGNIVENDAILMFAQSCRTNSFQVKAKKNFGLLNIFISKSIDIQFFADISKTIKATVSGKSLVNGLASSVLRLCIKSCSHPLRGCAWLLV